MVSQNVLPVVHGGAATTALLVIDIEQPARPDGFHALDRSTLVRVVNALRLRVAALKHAMPRCSVSFYGTPAPPISISTALSSHAKHTVAQDLLRPIDAGAQGRRPVCT